MVKLDFKVPSVIWKDKNVLGEAKYIYAYIFTKGIGRYIVDINIGELQQTLKIKNKVEEYYNDASRKEILNKSLTNCSKIIVVSSIDEAIQYSNRIAPEHLELAMDNAMDYVDKIENAGAIFIGHYSPEALGDYMAGPNHILPTVSTARFFSPLGVDDFIKKSSLIAFTKEATLKLVDDVDTFAQAEGLTMHALPARVRKEN